MTITVPNAEKGVRFRDLEIGDMFIFEGEVYIKIASNNYDKMPWCVINLTTRDYENFADDKRIYQIIKNITVEL